MISLRRGPASGLTGSLLFGLAILASPSGNAAINPNDHRAGPPGQEIRTLPHIAVDPLRPGVVIVGDTAIHDSYTTAQVFGSSSSITTWARTAALRTVHGANSTGEPAVARLASGQMVVAYLNWHSTPGKGIYATAPFAGGLLATSTNNYGRSWATPTLLDREGPNGATCSFPIDPASASRGSTISVVWTVQVLDASCSTVKWYELRIATSTNAGASWRTIRLPFASEASTVDPAVAIGPDGAIYAVGRQSCFEPLPHCPAGSFNLVAYSSGTHGRTFYGPVAIGDGFGNDRNAIAVDERTGAVLALSAAYGTLLDSHPRVWVSRDRNRSWRSTAQPLSRQIDAAMPSLASQPGGHTIAMLVLLNGHSSGYVPAITTTDNDGQSWSCLRPVATVPSPNPPSIYSSRTALGLEASGRVHSVWPDTREVRPAETTYTSTLAPTRLASLPCLSAPPATRSATNPASAQLPLGSPLMVDR
jgi:hypothetical protein